MYRFSHADFSLPTLTPLLDLLQLILVLILLIKLHFFHGHRRLTLQIHSVFQPQLTTLLSATT